jgi:hypothetical protein
MKKDSDKISKKKVTLDDLAVMFNDGIERIDAIFSRMEKTSTDCENSKEKITYEYF